MGQLLKPRVISREQAREKLDSDIAEARARYERRIKAIEENETKWQGKEPLLGVRASNGLRYVYSASLPRKANRFGRMEMTWFDGEITPKMASKLTAKEMLECPNFGHKAISEVAAWLSFHGYELKP